MSCLTEPVVCTGPGGAHVGDALAASLGLPRAEVETRTFPDGELSVRIAGDVRGAEVVIVQGTHPPQERHLQELYQLIEAAHAAGAASIVAIVPYLAYARQDRRSRDGEALSSQIVLRTVAMLGARTLVTFDVHNPVSYRSERLEAVNLTAGPLFERWLAEQADAPVLIAPDDGAWPRAAAVAERLDLPVARCAKHKDPDGRTWYDGAPTHEVRGRHAVVIDDLCSSGSTIAPLSRHLEAHGAQRLTFAVTHLLADPDAVLRQLHLPAEILSTDTVPGPAARLSVVPELAAWLSDARA